MQRTKLIVFCLDIGPNAADDIRTVAVCFGSHPLLALVL
jgi:hypothetical protein